ncbi:MAG: efflux RND transporter periplasmic adaptor subunit [Bacteroidia bacterium]|nr:efflux RND transporter periplasmic adaptor subunit [Bacteroidia bacterium]
MKQFSVFIIVCSILFIFGCKSQHTDHNPESVSYYTCPMHPSVVSSTPGSCPVCNMSLIKVEKKKSVPEGQQGNFITIDKYKQELAGIKTDTVKFRNIFSASAIIGTVAVDEERVKIISSRAKGRIDKLFVKATGGYIQSGNPLYSIYSEQLLADEKEYLAFYEKTNIASSTSKLTDEMKSASKNKLLLWGLKEKQISELEKSLKTNPLITFYSQESGYVTEVNITEGMYVEEGSPLIKIISLDQVWIEAQLYSNEISKTMDIKSFQVYSESNPNDVYKGTLVYNSPLIEDGRRVLILRIRVDNTKGKFIPGMMVSVSPQKNTQPVLAAPKSSILLEKMKTAWVKTNENTFEQRMIETGTQNKHWIEILSGLKQGDILVTEGAYLISSEFILKSGAGQRHEH